MTDAWRLPATEAARLLAARELSSEELVAVVPRADRGAGAGAAAWARLDSEAALAQARERDEEPARGPLHGIPVGVKDVIDTADAPTGYGSPIYAGHQPQRDADASPGCARPGRSCSARP